MFFDPAGHFPDFHHGLLRAELTRRGIPLFKADIPRLKSFEKAVAEGVPVYQVNDARAQRAWEAYESAGKEILNGSAGR